MIIKWEIIPYPSEKYPDRYKVNIKCDYTDLKKISDFYGKQCGLPWKSKDPDFSFSFYIYKMTSQKAEEFENKIKEFQGSAAEPQIADLKKEETVPYVMPGTGTPQPEEKPEISSRTDGSLYRQESRQPVSPPRPSKKQPTTGEIKAAKEISAIIDFDVFDPEKLEGIEIKKGTVAREVKKEASPLPLPSGDAADVPSVNVKATVAQKEETPVAVPQEPVIREVKTPPPVKAEPSKEQDTILVGIIYRSGQEEYSKIIEENIFKSTSGKKLKYKIKVAFTKGFLVFSQDDINDAIALCREKGVSSVIVAGESKLAEVLHDVFNSAGIFTEHINTTDVNKKSFYFNIVTDIILSESGKKQDKQK